MGRRFDKAGVTALLASAALAGGMTVAQAAEEARCRALLRQIDDFTSRARFTPAAKPAFDARAEAGRHLEAGRHAACISAAENALRLLGRQSS